MTRGRLASRPAATLLLLLMTLIGVVAAALPGCGTGGSSLITIGETTTSAAPVSTDFGTGAPASPTDITIPPTTEPPGGPTTTVAIGTTTVTATPQTRSMTFIGPMTPELWNALRDVVNDAGADGDKVLAGVKRLNAGDTVDVKVDELDAFYGLGFAVGASTGQPIAVAVDEGGRQYIVFAFSVTGQPAKTTIVGFERGDLQHVGLVVGPLPISDKMENITTVP